MMSLLQWNMFVSSANKINSFEALKMSSIYIINNVGPKMEPQNHNFYTDQTVIYFLNNSQSTYVLYHEHHRNNFVLPIHHAQW